MFGKLLKPGPRYSWKRVALTVTLSCCCLSGGASGLYLFSRYVTHLHVTNETSVIQAVVQTAGEYAPLQTTYLAEVLELSHDKPANFSAFDLEKGCERLLASQVIREALIKKIKPDTLYVEYAMRTPIAFLGDYTNTALDEGGALFPYLPFYPPRHLPELYLGGEAPPNPWGETIGEEQARLVSDILDRFEVGALERIDLSQSHAPSAGQRQIVLVLKGGTILRLTSKNYPQELAHYFILAEQLSQEASVIDFRNPEVAYITYEE